MDEQRNEERNPNEFVFYDQPSPQGGGYRKFPQEPSSKKGKKGLIIALICLSVAIILAVLLNVFGVGGAKVQHAPNDPYIQVVRVNGEITANSNNYGIATSGYDHARTLEIIDELMEDPWNNGILLYVDSPGGGVYESDELYLKLKEYQETTDCPVYAYFGSMAASGGYYVSANADKIYANRNCWTGSIGITIGTLFDVSGLLEKYGIKTTTITSGANKSMGGYTEPLTAEQEQIFRSLVDEAYVQFVDIVAEGREMDAETVRKIADGRIYTAKQAQELGLIDGVMTYEEAKVEMLDSDENLGNCEFYEEIPEEMTWIDYLISSGYQSAAGDFDSAKQSDVTALLELLGKSGEYPVSYLCEVLK